MGFAGLTTVKLLFCCRSIGDADLKDQGVTAEPQVTEFQLQPDDSFLIIASDGLWDAVSNTDAVGLVHDTVKQPAMCAQRCAAAPRQSFVHPCLTDSSLPGSDRIVVLLSSLRSYLFVAFVQLHTGECRGRS